MFIRNVDGQGLLLERDSVQPATAGGLKAFITSTYGLPREEIYLEQENKTLSDQELMSAMTQSTIHVKLRILGGKGGFGSLLRGQAPKKKYTTNYESCRDLSGRR